MLYNWKGRFNHVAWWLFLKFLSVFKMGVLAPFWKFLKSLFLSYYDMILKVATNRKWKNILKLVTVTCCYTTHVVTCKRWAVSNRLLSTIDSNVLFLHSQYSCIFTLSVQLYFYITTVNSVLSPTKLLVIILEQRAYLTVKRVQF